MGNDQRRYAGDDTHMVIVQLVGTTGIGGRKGPVRVPGLEGTEDEITKGECRGGGDGSEVRDRVAGGPVGTVGAGSGDAATAESADDEANTVAIAVGAGMTFEIGRLQGGNGIDGLKKLSDGHDKAPYDSGVALTEMVAREIVARSAGSTGIRRADEVTESLAARDEMMKVG